MKQTFAQKIGCLFCLCCLTAIAPAQTVQSQMNERYRPQIHFSPAKAWMNDPNGMVFYKGVYHLFFQYYPKDTHWGPMHWGHATSTDLLHWKEQPIALYPDSLGMIFSGSAVVDMNNTSGFGVKGQTPIVAIFTQHDPKREKLGRNDFQNQSLAYSLDEGKSWTKYKQNPVLKNPGIIDFRDPKVRWFPASKNWIMTLATKDHITFYSSPNLKDWKEESEFGNEFGAHGGVWECPDLFPLSYEGKEIWVLTVSLNPGGPNSGSATQYFTGNFDGSKFTPFETNTKWVDYGRDDYAGVTWSNTGSRTIYLGWMSNWEYANVVPTEKWRSANTIPRELSLQKQDGHYFLSSEPVKELDNLRIHTQKMENIRTGNFTITPANAGKPFPAILKLSSDSLKSFSLIIENESGDNIRVGFDSKSNSYYIDRTRSGNIGFHKLFPGKSLAPRISKKSGLDITLVIDEASVELFADKGLTVMTEIFFPTKPFNKLSITSPTNFVCKKIEYAKLESSWKNK
jgi:fructan beta-fructosidase